MLTVLEMALRELLGLDSSRVPQSFLANLTALHTSLKSPELLTQLASLVALEEGVYRLGHKSNYFANRFAVDVLTDTTERSPTFCTPPFRKCDDVGAAESWAFLFLPDAETPAALRNLLQREPRCLDWSEDEIRSLVPADKLPRTLEILRQIRVEELMRFKIGQDGRSLRPLVRGDCSIAVIAGEETKAFDAFARGRLDAAQKASVQCGLIYFGKPTLHKLPSVVEQVFVPVSQTDLLLDGVTRVAVKLVLNALSTCTMVRLGRVMGNCMIYVVPTNLKLIDRATRYIVQLTGLTYEEANALLFEVIEYVEPRMKSDQAYPPVVGLAVLRVTNTLTNEQAEERLME
jgi:N-acetylmuramic acid 6-phosphate etherase